MRQTLSPFAIIPVLFLVAGCGCGIDWIGQHDGPQVICGDGVVDGTEICERGQIFDCDQVDSSRFLSGSASCRYDCYGLDTSGCIEKDVCGNGAIEEGEECEWGQTIPCTSLDNDLYLSGTATCNTSSCKWGASSCVKMNVCGNGIIEESVGEVCDSGSTLCTDISDQYVGGYAQCLSDCSGWFFDYCTPTNVCGNEVVENDEVCDTPYADLCINLGDQYLGGTALCMSDCSGWDIAGCIPANVCGNSVVENDEVCDTPYATLCTNLGDQYLGGTAFCKNDCSGWDADTCTKPDKCGNGIIDDISEECEKGMGIPCLELDPVKYVGGIAACNAECSGWDHAGCLLPNTCGNGIFELGEECELSDTIPCTELDPVGFLPGNAPCKNDCSGWNSSLCDTWEVCGNGIREEGETCDTLPTACSNIDPVKWGFGIAQCREDCGGWETDACLAPVDPDNMANVSGGTFYMGCDPQQQNDCLEMEKPKHAVTLSNYSIDRNEVTVAQYELCIAAGKCTGNMYGTYAGATACNIGSTRDKQMPANCISWNGAQAYCAWKKKRLPTEAEWELAARGSGGREYPWGDQAADCGRAVFDSGGPGCTTGATFAVGSFSDGVSPFGLYDMAGNVREWVADRYASDYYWYGEKYDPSGPASGDMRVLRGGSWKTDARSLKSYARYANLPAMTYTDLGFRCAK